jgi:hypothetical protein
MVLMGGSLMLASLNKNHVLSEFILFPRLLATRLLFSNPLINSNLITLRGASDGWVLDVSLSEQ